MRITKTLTYDVTRVGDAYYYTDEEGFVNRITSDDLDGFTLDPGEDDTPIGSVRYLYNKVIHDSGLLDEGYSLSYISKDFLQIIKPSSDEDQFGAAYGLLMTDSTVVIMIMSLISELPAGLVNALEANVSDKFIIISKYNQYMNDHYPEGKDESV